MIDPYEKLRDLLTESAYCRSDLEADQVVRRAATNLAESVRKIVDVGKRLEQAVLELESVDQVQGLVDLLTEIHDALLFPLTQQIEATGDELRSHAGE